MTRDELLTRVEAAYEANGIPFDGFPTDLDDEKLLETAEYWERRAAEPTPPPAERSILELESTVAIKRRLQNLSGFARCDGRAAIAASAVQYHGPGARYDS